MIVDRDLSTASNVCLSIYQSAGCSSNIFFVLYSFFIFKLFNIKYNDIYGVDTVTDPNADVAAKLGK